MTTKPALTIAGLLAGVGIAAWLLKREEEGEDVSIFDYVGDIWVQLTTTEEGRISKLQPEVQHELRLLLSDLFAANIPVEVGQTLRTRAQEKALIAEGKTAAGLTYSWHELGRAVDMYPINLESGIADRDGKDVEAFRRMHQIAAGRGWRGIAFNSDGTKHLITNSKGKKIWDGGHLEWRSPYDTLAQAVAAEGAEYGIA